VNKKFKILHVFYLGGGISTSIKLITKYTNQEKFEHIVLNGTDEQKNLGLINSTIYNLKFGREIHFFKDVVLFFKTLRICLKEKPDLIHGHSAKGGIISKLLGFFANTPCLHTPQAYSYLSTQNKIKKAFYFFIEKCLKVLPHKILASSNSEKVRAIEELNYPENRVFTFSNAISQITDLSNSKTEFFLPKKYICSVGRPSFQKNIEYMIEVLREIKKTDSEIHLVIMGVGFYSPNLESVKNKIKKYDLEENVTLLEWLSRESIFNIVKSSQLYISTARYEGLPYAVIEALALKKALVLTNVDGNKDLVDDGQNGYLVDENNVSDFKEKVIELLQNDEKRNRFEINSYEKFSESFDITKTITQLEEIYLKEFHKQ